MKCPYVNMVYEDLGLDTLHDSDFIHNARLRNFYR